MSSVPFMESLVIRNLWHIELALICVVLFYLFFCCFADIKFWTFSHLFACLVTSTSNVFAWNRACISTSQLFRPDINAGLFSLSLITRGLDFFCYAWQCEVALVCYYWSITINIIDPFVVRWYACLILALRLHALGWFSQNLPAAWKRCRYAILACTATKSTEYYFYLLYRGDATHPDIYRWFKTKWSHCNCCCFKLTHHY